MEVDFQLLFKQILAGDDTALSQLTLTSSLIVRNWARKEKQELRWVARQDGSMIDYLHLVNEVVHRYISENGKITGDLLSMEHFKGFLIEEFGKEIRNCFSDFMRTLKANRQDSWKIVFDDLECRSASWFYKRNWSYKEENHLLFCESLESVYMKFMNNEFVFNDSCAFKSYFFRTLEIRYFEFVKDPYLKRSVSYEAIDFRGISDNEKESTKELTTGQKILKVALNNLRPDEKFILTAYFYGQKKLKEIASETGQTEENVRIKKFRALKKLFKDFKQRGYESQGSGK